MSLYADEETDLFPSFTGAAEVQAPLDPVQALTVALSAPGESRQQADALLAAGTRYEEHPDRLPDLVSRLLPMITDGGDSLLRAWTLDMVALAVGRADLDTNVKLDGGWCGCFADTSCAEESGFVESSAQEQECDDAPGCDSHLQQHLSHAVQVFVSRW